MKSFPLSFLFCGVVALFAFDPSARAIVITLPRDPSPRVKFGAERLQEALKAVGEEVRVGDVAASVEKAELRIEFGRTNDSELAGSLATKKISLPKEELGTEGFMLKTAPDGATLVVGGGDSGLLYGALELAKRVEAARGVPKSLDVVERPALKLRGPCIGMQKPYILPGRHVYEYPYTPDLFPFFYDKAFWEKYLDFLAANRMNTLYLWNGHPFASLVKLKDYPYALEVPEDIFQRNVEMYRYLTTEADKRGIWVVQMFYNIILSKPFAEHNGMSTQLSAVNPVAADYTRKSIAEFVKQYPNVGLLVCLGEALQDVPQQTQWCTDVILAGVKDGMREAGLKEEPPIIIRAHATDESVVMPAALKVYKNLYTEAKYNGESLTTWEPRGMWQARHLAMSKIGMHVSNVHILANLEPFRYGAQRFIKQSVLAMRDRLGSTGLHLYPLSYWNWPYSPDLTDPPLEQIDRDWIWFEAWSRYAWNPDIDEATDHAYWIQRLVERYGTPEAAEKILAAYNDSGECAPRLLRRFGITEGNRQTLSLGMTLDQLVDPERFHAYPELWLSQAPPGERLNEYVDKELKGLPHIGETPVSIISEVLDYSARAASEIDQAADHVTKNRDEFARLRNDVYCIKAMSENYSAKARAALYVLRYRKTGAADDFSKADNFLAESLEHYRTLVKLTESTYRFANSMQTSQRRIPVTGGIDGHPANFLWSQLLPMYEKELATFPSKFGATGTASQKASKPVRAVAYSVKSSDARIYQVEVGAKVFSDADTKIETLDPTLKQLKGIQVSTTDAAAGKYESFTFELAQPGSVLVGYLHTPRDGWLKVPQLETDALAGEHGSVEAWKENALTLTGVGAVDLYAFPFTAGTHQLELRGKGNFVLLGVAARE